MVFNRWQIEFGLEPHIECGRLVVLIEFNVRDDHELRLAAFGFTGLRLPERVQMNTDVRLEPPAHLGSGLFFRDPLSIGAFTLINGGRIRKATIGRYCSIAAAATIGAAEHALDRVTTSTITWDPALHGWDRFYDAGRAGEFALNGIPMPENGRPHTHVGHDVWIGHGAFIKAGITIGTGAVIGAGAVVTRDVPPYAIVTGGPAIVRRYRFKDADVDLLLKSEWWRYPLYELLGEQIMHPRHFVDRLNSLKSRGAIRTYEPPIIGADRLRSELENSGRGQQL